MGCGKSMVAVKLIEEAGATVSIILAPKSVVKNVWVGEFAKHSVQPVLVAALYKGTAKQKAKGAQEAIALGAAQGKPVVIVVAYQSAWRSAFADWALGRQWDMAVLDESHKIKAPGGKTAQFCAKLGLISKRRLALTGTPMPHGPLDVYAQYRFLDPGIFGTNYSRFKQTYAKVHKLAGGGEIVQGYQSLDELKAKMYSIAFRVRSKDVLDLPPIQHITRTCVLSKAGAKVYMDLKKEAVAELDSGEVTAENALTKLLRLQQVTGGFVTTDEGEEVAVCTAKADLLADTLEDIAPAEPVVVFARFSHDLRQVSAAAEAAGRPYFELSGRIDQVAEWKKAARAAMKLAEQDKEAVAPVIGVQIQAGGAGIDLTEARYALYYSKGFNMGDYEQSLARCHRPGQTRLTYVIHLQAEGTVDDKEREVLENRAALVADVMNEGLDGLDEDAAKAAVQDRALKSILYGLRTAPAVVGEDNEEGGAA
jgi:SNF2 family DNA or RNA helicase